MKFIQGKTYYFVFTLGVPTPKGLIYLAITHKLLICSTSQDQRPGEILWKLSRNKLSRTEVPYNAKIFTSRRKAESYRKQLEKTL